MITLLLYICISWIKKVSWRSITDKKPGLSVAPLRQKVNQVKEQNKKFFRWPNSNRIQLKQQLLLRIVNKNKNCNYKKMRKKRVFIILYTSSLATLMPFSISISGQRECRNATHHSQILFFKDDTVIFRL